MPGSLVQELFDKGIVTKRHPTLLDVGELQQADDCVYRRFDPSIQRVNGRIEFRANTIAGALPVKGVAHLPFDATNDLILGYVGPTLYQAPLTAIPGTTDFTAIPGIGTMSNVGTEIMNVVPFGTTYYVLASNTSPRRVLYITPTQVDVASCTITTLTTLTTSTTKGFKNVVVGQYVTGSGGGGAIAANSRVASKVSDTVITLDTNGTNGGPFVATFASTAFVQGSQAGLKPTSLPVNATVTAGSWSQTSDMGIGKYWFIYTEMLVPGVVDDIENGFIESGMTLPNTSWANATITTPGSQSIQISRPNVVNSSDNGLNNATHWQIYMSDKQTVGTTLPPDLSTFKRIGDIIPITQTTILLTDSNLTQGGNNPTANSALSGVTQFTTPAGGRIPNDNVFATTPLNQNTVGNSYSTFNFVSSGAVNGGSLTGSETILGIRITLTGANLAGTCVIKNASKVGSEKQFIVGNVFAGHPGPNTVLGGATDTWNETWTPADFLNANSFVVEIRAHSITNKGAALDGIEVLITYTGTTINRNGKPFKTVTYRSQIGLTVTDTVNLPPPVATTGDTFMGSMVLNDEASPASIVYSQPAIADSYAVPYRMKFNTASKDIVTNIKRLGQVLVVGLRDNIQRINYLPTELDTDFHEGIAHEDLASDHGIMGPHAATLFDYNEGGPVLAYISFRGLHMTNGITTRYLNIDLDWSNTVNVTNLSTCILRNYSSENWLILYYNPSGASHTQNTRALVFPYSPDKVKDGGFLPAIGPFKVSARSVCESKIGSVSYMLSGHNTLGKVYVEDNGLTNPASYTVADSSGSETAVVISPFVKTRRMYGSGVSRQSREQRIYVMCDAAGATVSVTANCNSGATSITNVSNIALLAVGQLIVGTCFQPDTIITNLPGGNTATISKPTIAGGTGTTVTASTGTLGVIAYGQDTNAALAAITAYGYQSTLTGGLIVYHLDSLKESHEFVISRVQLPDLTQVQVNIAMRLHHFSYLASDMGLESHRA